MISWNQLSAFDLDKTLLSKNSSFQFGFYLYKTGKIPFSSLLFILSCHMRHTAGLLPVEKLHQTAFRFLFAGRFASEIESLAQEFVNIHLESLIYLPAILALKEAQKAGHLTVIISSSPNFLVKPIAQRLGADLWEATEYIIDDVGRFYHLERPILGDDKARLVVQLSHKFDIPKKNIAAYSDSHLDLPFLLSAGTAIGVNPNRKLRAACRKNCWPII